MPGKGEVLHFRASPLTFVIHNTRNDAIDISGMVKRRTIPIGIPILISNSFNTHHNPFNANGVPPQVYSPLESGIELFYLSQSYLDTSQHSFLLSFLRLGENGHRTKRSNGCVTRPDDSWRSQAEE